MRDEGWVEQRPAGAATGRTITLFGVDFDLRLTLLIVFSTVVPMLDFYGHSPTGVKACLLYTSLEEMNHPQIGQIRQI